MAPKAIKSGAFIGVGVDGLAEADRIPGWLERGRTDALNEGVRRVRADLERASPRRSGRLAAGWSSGTLTPTTGRVANAVPYLRAQARGFYSAPKAGRALTFTAGGGRVFAAWTRYRPKKDFIRVGIRKRRAHLQEAFTEALDEYRGGRG